MIPLLAERWTVTTVDRTGWGDSPPPEDYRKTSIAEQAISIAGAAAGALDAGSLTVAGVGLGAVVSFELGIAYPGLVDRVVMVDPPLFGTLPEATAGVSADVELIRSTVEEGGEAAAYELFLAGGLTTLGAGGERLASHAFRGPGAPRSFLVELPAVPAWPLDPTRLSGLPARVTVASTATAPPILGDAAAAFAARLEYADLIGLESDGPPAVAEAL